MSARTDMVRASYAAYESGDREAVERLLADDFTFFSPPDPGIDRERYFERCWPASQHLNRFDLVRLIESGDEIVATYEAERSDGSRFRNTEIFTIAGDRIASVEVYFGWDL